MVGFLKKHRRLLTPTFVISFFILFFIVAGSFLAPILAPYDPEEMDLVITSTWNVILVFPSILLTFVIMGVIGKGITAGIIALGIVYIPMISRLTRSLTMVEKNKTYVEAARVLGYSNRRILFRHILPNCIPTLLAELTVDLAYAILDLAGLSYLGLGIQPPQSDWGYMLSDAQQYLTTYPLQALFPGLMIVLVVISLNLLSNELSAYTDASLRRMGSFHSWQKKAQKEREKQHRKEEIGDELYT